MNPRRPALLELHGKADGGRLERGELDRAPCVLLDGVFRGRGDRLPGAPSRYSMRHEAGKRHCTPAGVVEPVDLRPLEVTGFFQVYWTHSSPP